MTLGEIAWEFRGDRDMHRRIELIGLYRNEVERLIASGIWDEMPGFEDRLPRDLMPDEFYIYWGQRV